MFYFKKNKIIKSGLTLILILFSLFLFTQNNTRAATSPDAIATRVIPNPEHLSPLAWYQANIKNQGSPQALEVDGYEAIRDGRTVYVNAANIDLTNNNFYTNIYLLSFNQDVEQATEDIFGQLLTHWQFNTNISAEQKDRVRNDTKRLADLAEIKSSLNKYQLVHNGDFPSLAAGSYMAGKSISVWPSWQATLAKELGVNLPIDPVNKLGACLNFDPLTCWNQTIKKFYDPTPNDNQFNLSDNSRAYVYTYNGRGLYNVCALLESAYSNISASSCYAASCTSNGCEANTCTGSTCNNGCNPTAPGVKITGICCISNGCEANTCLDSTCNNGCNPTAPGVKITGICCISNGCEANTCTGSTCNNGCNPTAPGTKTDGVCCVSNGCEFITCAGLTCNNGCNSTVPGTKTDGVCCVSNGCEFITCAGLTCNNGCNPAAPGTITTGTCCVSNGCEANTCTGSTCNNGCNPAASGTKTDGTCCASNGCEANTCTGSTCNNGCNPAASGTKTTGTCCISNGCEANTCTGSTCNNGCNPAASGTKTTGTCCISNGCEANTCTGSTCDNGCSPTALGTKTTGTCCISNGCEANTCTDSTCNNGCNPAAPGTKTSGTCCVSNGCEADTCVGLTCINGCNPSAPGTKTGAACPSFSVSGNITDAMTNFALILARVTVKDSGGTIIATAFTDSSGYYSILIFPGNYTMVISKTGYTDGTADLNLVSNTTKDFSLANYSAGIMRIKLTWGESPPDLDAHLEFGATHIYFDNKEENGATLDVDNTNKFGPEVISIDSLVAGVTYTYWVFDYNENPALAGVTTAGALVEIFNSGGEKVKEYNSPGAGTWVVFRFDVSPAGVMSDFY